MEIKKTAGRPKLQLDERQIRELASLGTPLIDIAVVMGCHADTIRDNYSTALSEGRENGKISLRRAQWKSALAGNVSMLQWLGRFYLGQHEEITFSSSEPEVRKLLEQWEISAKKKSYFEKQKDSAIASLTTAVDI